jgi:hypothetical protein
MLNHLTHKNSKRYISPELQLKNGKKQLVNSENRRSLRFTESIVAADSNSELYGKYAEVFVAHKVNGRNLIGGNIGLVNANNAKNKVNQSEEDMMASESWVNLSDLDLQNESKKVGFGVRYIGKEPLTTGVIVCKYLAEQTQNPDIDAYNHYQTKVEKLVVKPYWLNASRCGNIGTFINHNSVDANCGLRTVQFGNKVYVVVEAILTISSGDFLSICYSGNALNSRERNNIAASHQLCIVRSASLAKSAQKPRRLICSV